MLIYLSFIYVSIYLSIFIYYLFMYLYIYVSVYVCIYLKLSKYIYSVREKCQICGKTGQAKRCDTFVKRHVSFLTVENQQTETSWTHHGQANLVFEDSCARELK